MDPSRFLRAFLYALVIHEPSVSLQDMAFCAFPIPPKDGGRQPLPENGILVQGIIFR